MNFSNYLFNVLNVRKTIAVDYNNISKKIVGTYYPSVTSWPLTDAAHLLRYGFSIKAIKGNLVGERFSWDVLVAFCAKNNLNPPTELDAYDCKLCSADGIRSVYDSIVLPFVQVSPIEPIVTTPPTTPVVTTPVVITPPNIPTGSTIEQRISMLEAKLATITTFFKSL